VFLELCRIMPEQSQLDVRYIIQLWIPAIIGLLRLWFIMANYYGQ
jgi:hypothetical protein